MLAKQGYSKILSLSCSLRKDFVDVEDRVDQGGAVQLPCNRSLIFQWGISGWEGIVRAKLVEAGRAVV
jgi:hypothetical protein